MESARAALVVVRVFFRFCLDFRHVNPVCFFSAVKVASMLDAKGVGNITPQEIMEALSSFGMEGEAAEDVLIEVCLPPGGCVANVLPFAAAYDVRPLPSFSYVVTHVCWCLRFSLYSVTLQYSSCFQLMFAVPRRVVNSQPV